MGFPAVGFSKAICSASLSWKTFRQETPATAVAKDVVVSSTRKDASSAMNPNSIGGKRRIKRNEGGPALQRAQQGRVQRDGTIVQQADAIARTNAEADKVTSDLIRSCVKLRVAQMFGATDQGDGMRACIT